MRQGAAPARRGSGVGRGPRGALLRRLLATAGPALVVLALGGVLYDALGRLDESRAWVLHTRQVIEASQRTLSALQDLETGQRGYLLTGDVRYLAPYRAGAAAVRADTTVLRRLTRDNPSQQRRLDTLGALVRAKATELERTIALRRDGRAAEALALVEAGRGKALMDASRVALARIAAEERRLLAAREAREDQHARLLYALLLVGTLLAALSGFLTNRWLAGAAHRAQEDAHALADQAEQLEQQALELEIHSQQLQEQQVELEAQTVELEMANQELGELVAQLEARSAAEEQARRDAEQALARADQANRAKGEFLAVMSHELRTPLNAIGGYVDLMQLGIPDPVPPSQHDYLERIKRSQQHLLALITDVLNYARIEAGRLTYESRVVPVPALIAAVEPMVVLQASQRGVALDLAPIDPALAVRADPEKAAQVLLNLVGNGIKFTPPGGRVTVDAELLGDRVAVRVRDTGIGIADEQRARIFEPFVQVDQRLTRTAEGIGLGLAISRDLAHGMGGALSVESTPGEGSTFRFVLPRADGGADGASDGGAAHAASAPGGTPGRPTASS